MPASIWAGAGRMVALAVSAVMVSSGAAASERPADPYDVPWKNVPVEEQGALPERVKEPLVRDFVTSRKFRVEHYLEIPGGELDARKLENVQVRRCERCGTLGDDVWSVSDPTKTAYCNGLLRRIQAGDFTVVEPEYHRTLEDLLAGPQKGKCERLLYAVRDYDPDLPPPGITSISRLYIRLYPLGPSRVLVTGDGNCEMEQYVNNSCSPAQYQSRSGGYVVNTEDCRPEYGMGTLIFHDAFPGTVHFIPIVVRVDQVHLIARANNAFGFVPGPARFEFAPAEWAPAKEFCIAEAVQ